jgi:protoporphyrinogen oxidase
MRVGIVGAGIAGLTAAYELGKAGREVVLFEQAPGPGGLASTFKDERWDWPLEKFYHHLFASDDVVLRLSHEIGLADKIFVPRPITAIWQNGDINAFDSVPAVLRYPHLTFVQKMRVGLVILYMRLTRNWRPLERYTAHEWLPRYTGQRAYQTLLQPLLANKFGERYREVNMAWFWARFHKRTPRLGYYQGGYQALIDALVQQVRQQGGKLRLEQAVSRIVGAYPALAIQTEEGAEEFDSVISTVSPQQMSQMAVTLPEAYRRQVDGLESVGALTLILALRHRVTKGYYWINLPSGAFPFVAFVEHTNYQSPQRYGGDHIVYLGDYHEPGHRYFQMSREELLEEFLPHLAKFRADFEPSWVRESWLFREAYAQPLPPVDYSKQIPPVRTPVPGLYYASMSQVYPWDRGTNYAVEIGQQASRLLLEDFPVASL